MRTAAIIVAAGQGTRAGGAVPKQFAPVAGLPILAHSVRVLVAHPAVDEVVVVVAPGQEALARAAAGADVRLVAGGALRRDSVANGLAATGADRVLIHDAARPFLPAVVIDRVLAALTGAAGATPVLPVADTLARGKTTLADVIDRAGLWRVQTPQGFDAATLRRAHAVWNGADEATDDAQMVRRLGLAVALVQGDPMLEKVTHPEDFARAEAHAAWEWRSATGFDVHRLESGEELWLGGVLIPHDRGLSGHSDADVALHALTDALLGTIAAGDIGTHFPPSDRAWKGAASHQCLTPAAGVIAARGGKVSFVDLTLICEEPKIGPYRAAMQARIADLLGLTPDRVSIKATTTERLGFTGRGSCAGAAASRRVKAALALLLAAAPAQLPRPCLTAPEAQAVALVALPEILRETGVACAAALPPASLLRRSSSPLLTRYDAEADRAWPAARAALVKLSDSSAEALLGSQFARGVLTSLVAPVIVGRIAPRACGTVARLVPALEPLPPRNAADVVVTTLQYLAGQKPQPGRPNPAAALPLCSGPR